MKSKKHFYSDQKAIPKSRHPAPQQKAQLRGHSYSEWGLASLPSDSTVLTPFQVPSNSCNGMSLCPVTVPYSWQGWVWITLSPAQPLLQSKGSLSHHPPPLEH